MQEGAGGSRRRSSRRPRRCCASGAAPRRARPPRASRPKASSASTVAADGKTAAMVEVNCETDFVAKNDDFRAFANETRRSWSSDEQSGRRRCALPRCRSRRGTVEARRSALVQKIGENISLRRFARLAAEGAHCVVRARRAGSACWSTIGRRRDARQGPRDAHRRDQAAAPSSREQVPAELDRQGARDRRAHARPSRASRPTSSKRWSKARSPSFSPRSRCWRSRS